jgi:magnesium-transporting ATPase (P-type)
MTNEEMNQTLNTKEYIYKFPIDKIYEVLKSTPDGLTQQQAEEKQKIQGKNLIDEKKKESVLIIFS